MKWTSQMPCEEAICLLVFYLHLRNLSLILSRFIITRAVYMYLLSIWLRNIHPAEKLYDILFPKHMKAVQDFH